MPTLDQIRACFSGDRYATETTGVLIQDAQPGACVCTLPLRPELLTANGTPMGGAIFTLADFAFAVAANACGTLTVSQCADMHYLRPGTGERLFAEAICVSAGRSTCLYRVEVTDGAGALVAVCMVTGFRRAPVNKA